MDWLGTVPQHTGHQVMIMKLPCCQSVGTDALLLCQRMGPGSAASPELATGCRNTWNRQRKGGRRAVDVV